MSERGRPLSLWGSWWNAIELLRPAFSRLSTFLWFATIVAGMTVRSDMLGVTSIVRALNLRPTLYHRLLAHFHSTGVKLDRLTALWAQVVLRLFPTALRVNGRLILIGDGIKCPKRGKKMPAVKLLHQQSDANTKPEYIMGHSLQAVSVLVRAANSFFAVPLAARIHEGLVWSNRDRRTLLDKMLALLGLVGIATPFYFVADAYYAAAKVANGLLAQGHHLVTRVKSNAVAYAPAEPPNGKRKRGRPRRYGRKIKLKSLLSDPRSMIELASPVYGERNVMLRYRVCDLIWRPAGRLVRFVAVIHPTRGSCLLMATDLSLKRWRHYLSLWPALQDRAQLQAGGPPDRRLRISFLDDGYDPFALPQRQSAPASPAGRLPQPCQAQNARLSRLHSGRRRGPRPAPVSRGRRPQAGLGLVRIVAAHHSSRHPAVRIRRRQRAAPPVSRFSPRFRKKRFPRKIHRRSPRHNKHARISPGIMRKNRHS